MAHRRSDAVGGERRWPWLAPGEARREAATTAPAAELPTHARDTPLLLLAASPIGTRSVGVSTEQETPTCRIEVMEITKLWWQLPMEAVLWKIEPPHVCEVAHCRADHAKKVEIGEVQRHHTAATASSQATRHSIPLAHRYGLDASACIESLLMSDLNDMSARWSVVDEESKAGDTWLKKHERKTMASKRSSWVWSNAIAAIVGCLSAV
uniref:Uncharacterized protein n=1 Tax=Oryza glumipatula TaxID=40148 RepID=A0A0D9YPA0_9ORYZ